MAQLFANNAVSTLAAQLTSGATTLSLAAGASFPSPSGGDFFLATITQGSGTETSWEIVKCTARSVNTLTITRAQEGTADATWLAGSKVALRLTAGTFGTASQLYSHPSTDETVTAKRTFQGAIKETPVTAVAGSAYTITDSSFHWITLTANCVLTFPTIEPGKAFTLVLRQDSTGGRSVTWPMTPTVVWPGSITPTLTGTANRSDVFSFVAIDNGYWLGFVGGLNYSF